ncbi:hypothetical protein FB567DRAFT_549003 [Paraphoma chrysanthemicola]|uniref:Uncharacterized protein n=1 Tax=Paraphoma chrysanthemicola TaxID=798071 RepID=A0A8K0R640_9PLEO|nr:hypothetical protein FB567DRAFT_549003 [Paraphoma chrysanthemicola]
MDTQGPACEMGGGQSKRSFHTRNPYGLIHAKERFAEDPERYNRLLKVFAEIYGSSAPDVPYETRMATIRAEMREDVLKDNNDLLQGFESFVPSRQDESSTSQDQEGNKNRARGEGPA